MGHFPTGFTNGSDANDVSDSDNDDDDDEKPNKVDEEEEDRSESPPKPKRKRGRPPKVPKTVTEEKPAKDRWVSGIVFSSGLEFDSR